MHAETAGGSQWWFRSTNIWIIIMIGWLFAQVFISVLLSYNENNVRGCYISSRCLCYELITHMNCHLVHHILPQDKSMVLIHQCTYKYCTQPSLWWSDAYLDNLVRHLGSRHSLSPKIKQHRDHMTITVFVGDYTNTRHARTHARFPVSPSLYLQLMIMMPVMKRQPATDSPMMRKDV